MLAAIVIISNNILIPRYGIEGAAWGSAFALITFNVIKFIFIYVKFGIQPFEWGTVKVLGIALITLFANSLLFKSENTFVDIVLRSGAITLIFSSLILMMKVSPEAGDLFKKVISIFNENFRKK